MRLLLHSCCAPCTTYCLEKLRSDGHEVHGYFYNPNIHPYTEFRRRLDAYRDTAHWLDWMPMLTRNMDSGSILRRSAGTLRADALRAIGCGSFPQRNLRSKEVLMRSPRPSPSAHIRIMSSWREWAKMCRRKWACLLSTMISRRDTGGALKYLGNWVFTGSHIAGAYSVKKNATPRSSGSRKRGIAMPLPTGPEPDRKQLGSCIARSTDGNVTLGSLGDPHIKDDADCLY
jgi:hypothetical protein